MEDDFSGKYINISATFDKRLLQTFKAYVAMANAKENEMLLNIVQKGLQKLDAPSEIREKIIDYVKEREFSLLGIHPTEQKTLRVTRDLWQKLREHAAKYQCSQSDLFCYLLNDFIDKKCEEEFVGNTNETLDIAQTRLIYKKLNREK